MERTVARGMHREDVKAVLRKKYGSLRAFEDANQLPPNSAKDVLRGRAVAGTERAIATELGKPLHLLFPLRYVAPEGGDSSAKVDTPPHDRTHRLSTGGR